VRRVYVYIDDCENVHAITDGARMPPEVGVVVCLTGRFASDKHIDALGWTLRNWLQRMRQNEEIPPYPY
jgi:hypothetical protein